MNDCTNAEMRDRLPDLIHDRLDARERTEVMAHVAGCADCRAEVEVLRAARTMFALRTPAVDVARIVSALPSPSRIPTPARRPVIDWRIAAAITVLVVGGGSFAVVNRTGSDSLTRDTLVAVQSSDTSPRRDSAPVLIADSQRATPPAARVVQSTPADDAQGGLAMTGRLGELSEAQLEALLKEIDRLEAVPITEPEPAMLPVNTTRPNTSGGTL